MAVNYFHTLNRFVPRCAWGWMGLSLLLAACSTGQFVSSEEALDSAKSNFERGQYIQAFRTAHTLAEKQGGADAQYLLAYLYFFGHGVAADRNKAHFWFTKASKQGHCDAITALDSIADYQGSGLPQPQTTLPQTPLPDILHSGCQKLRFTEDKVPTHQCLAKRGYTIQLIGFSHVRGLHQLCMKFKSYESLYYYSTCRKQKPWYVLVFGHYKDYASAREALQNIPEELKQWQPFIKKLSSAAREKEKSCST